MGADFDALWCGCKRGVVDYEVEGSLFAGGKVQVGCEEFFFVNSKTSAGAPKVAVQHVT